MENKTRRINANNTFDNVMNALYILKFDEKRIEELIFIFKLVKEYGYRGYTHEDSSIGYTDLCDIYKEKIGYKTLKQLKNESTN